MDTHIELTKHCQIMQMGHVCQRGGVPTATASWKGENVGFTALECNLLLAQKASGEQARPHPGNGTIKHYH